MNDAYRFAAEKHAAQRYGNAPYTVHLEAVRAVLRDAGFADDHPLAIAAWLHDTIEDTDTNEREVQSRFGEENTGVGQNRKERNAHAYAKIRAAPDAATLKLADRIANVEASANVPDKLAMYRKEWPGFRDALAGHGLPMLWERLENALGVGE